MLILIVWSKTEGTFQFILDKVTAIQEGPLQLYPGTETKWIKKKKQLSKHRMEFWVWATNASYYSCSIKPLLFHLKVTYSWSHLYFSQWTAVKQTHMIKWLIVLKIKDPENKIVNAPLALCLQPPGKIQNSILAVSGRCSDTWLRPTTVTNCPSWHHKGLGSFFTW